MVSSISLISAEDEIQYELERILKEGIISTLFQPIVSLRDGSVMGYEALSRGPEGSILKFPDKLFAAALSYDRLLELELLCRNRAIENARLLGRKKNLFLNVNPEILSDKSFNLTLTSDFLRKHNIGPETIIFELTEKKNIEDFERLTEVIHSLSQEGYKIAVDDTGAGYSGLNMLSKTRPQYLKIDMEIIRNIDSDPFKQSIIGCLINLSERTNMIVIAEGIETEEELGCLMDLGVPYGQGYILQKPALGFSDIPTYIRDFIITRSRLRNSQFSCASKNYIGEIVRCDKSLPLTTSCQVVKNYFDHSSATGVCIVQDKKPVGLVMKHTLNSVLATQYGVAVFSKRPINLVMDPKPLIVDYYTPLSEVSKAAMARDTERVYDYVIVTKDSKYCGIVTIRKLLEFTTMLECSYARELNPLTGLPGNSIIEGVLKDMIDYDHSSCVLYFDLDNFKSYNDNYGFENGDRIIKFTADLIESSVKSHFPYSNFVGHIGGDDFVCAVEGTYEKLSSLCKEINSAFDRGVLQFFNERDIAKGYIEGYDRNGSRSRFALTSISIAGYHGRFKSFNTVDELARVMSGIKKNAKKLQGSSFLIETVETFHNY